MKKITLFLLFICISQWSVAQIYTIDDTDMTPFEDISTTGTALGLLDDGEVNVTLPFMFDLDGQSSADVRIANNGGILFATTSGDLSFNNATLVPQNPALIAPFWDDIDDNTGDVFWEVLGTAPDRRFIVQWNDRAHFNNVGSGTFQALLFEGSNEILFVYEDVIFENDQGNDDFDNGGSATIGIASLNDIAQYSFNTPSLSGINAIRFMPILPPAEISCPDNIEEFIIDDLSCGVVVVYNPPVVTGTTNVATLVNGLPSGSFFPVGTTTNTFELMDNEGNILSCSFDVTVIDDIDPIIECPEDLTIMVAEGECTVVLPDYTIDVSADDNCPDFTITQDPTPGTIIDAGTTQMVTLTIIDVSNNINSCSFDVTITDGIAPTIECLEDLTLNVTEGECTIILPDYTIDVNASDNCPDFIITQDPIPGTVIDAGITETITLTITDTSDNVSNCSFEITVVDDIDPTIECPEDLTINAEEGQTTVILPDFIVDSIINDNCPDNLNIQQFPTPGSVVNVGDVIAVNIIVIDEAGNANECIFNVTIDPPLNIEDFVLNDNIDVYPNPTNGIITIDNTSNTTLNEAIITDLNGRILKTIVLDTSNTTQISLDKLSNGLYFIRINTDNASIIRRIVKN